MGFGASGGGGTPSCVDGEVRQASASSKDTGFAEAEWARDPGRRRSSRSSTGYLFSIRHGGGTHVFESRLERDFLELLDIDSSLNFFCQPETFHWIGRNSAHRWTPDVLIVPRHGRKRVFVEVKPWKVVKADPTLGGRVAGMIAQCRLRDAGFALLTEREIRGGRALAAAKQVRSCALRCDAAVTREILSKINPARLPSSFGDVAAAIRNEVARHALPGLIGLGFLRADLRMGLNSATIVSKGPRAWL